MAPAASGSWGARYPIALIALLSLGSLIMYTMRFNVTIALNGDSCNADVAAKYHWTNEDKGQVLGGFFWGYCILQVPGGLVATRYGGKVVLAVCMLGSAGFTALFPLLAGPGSQSVTWLVLARCGCGLCQSALYPAWAAMVSAHLPEARRNLAAGAFSGGASAGVIVAWLVLPGLQARWGWEYCFYLPALLGAVWFAMWVAVAPANPPKHTHTAAARRKPDDPDEKSRLLAETGGGDGGGTAGGVRTPREPSVLSFLWTMLSAPAMWGVYIASIAVGWVFYTLLSFLPQYMKQRYRLDLEHAASVSVIPYGLRLVVLLLVGRVTDWLLEGRAGLASVRKAMTAVSLVVPAAALLAIALVSVPETVAVSLLVIGVGASGMANVGAVYAPIEMYPATAGAAYAMGNFVGNVPGFVSPPLTGWLLDQGNCPKSTAKSCAGNGSHTLVGDAGWSNSSSPTVFTDECARAWNTVFLISVAVSAAGVLAYTVLGAKHPVYRRKPGGALGLQ